MGNTASNANSSNASNDPLDIVRRNIDSLEVLLQFTGDDKEFFQAEVARYNGIVEAMRVFRTGPMRILSEDANKVIDKLTALMDAYRAALAMHMRTFILCRAVVPRVVKSMSTYTSLVNDLLGNMTNNVRGAVKNADEGKAQADRTYANALALQKKALAAEENVRRDAAAIRRLNAEMGLGGRR